MNDQATTLRRLAGAPTLNLHAGLEGVKRQKHRDRVRSASGVRTIAVTGGKGGVGKSNVAVNVAIELVARGRNVSLLDADLGLANADVLLGLNPQYHLGDVISGQRPLGEVVMQTSSGLRLIPGGSGIEELASMSQDQHRQLISELRTLEAESDYMIIDTAAGIAGNVTGVLRAAAEVVVVTTPDPTAVVDAYALIKVLHGYAPHKPIWVVINDVIGIGDAEQTFAHLRTTTMRFLNHPLEHLGTVPRDPELAEAVREQVPVVEYAPETPASRAFRLIAKHLEQGCGAQAEYKTASSFWNLLLETED